MEKERDWVQLAGEWEASGLSRTVRWGLDGPWRLAEGTFVEDSKRETERAGIFWKTGTGSNPTPTRGWRAHLLELCSCSLRIPIAMTFDVTPFSVVGRDCRSHSALDLSCSIRIHSTMHAVYEPAHPRQETQQPTVKKISFTCCCRFISFIWTLSSAHRSNSSVEQTSGFKARAAKGNRRDSCICKTRSRYTIPHATAQTLTSTTVARNFDIKQR